MFQKLAKSEGVGLQGLDDLTWNDPTDTDDDSDLVADVDPDTLIRIVRTELKKVRLQV